MNIVIPRAFKESNFRGRSIYNCMRNKKTIKVLQNPLEDFSVRMLVIIYALTSCTFIMHVSNVEW